MIAERGRFLSDLDEAIRIKSVSAWPDNRKVGEWAFQLPTMHGFLILIEEREDTIKSCQ